MNLKHDVIIHGRGVKAGDEVRFWNGDKPAGSARVTRVIDCNTFTVGPLPWHLRLWAWAQGVWSRFKARFL